MAKTLKSSTEQLAATSLYQWYLGQETSANAAMHFYQWVSTHSREAPLSTQEMTLALERIRSHGSFAKTSASFLNHWRKPMEACKRQPKQALAKQFLQHWIEAQDHGLVFNHTILASTSRIEAGQIGDGISYMYTHRDFWTLHLTLTGSALYTSDRDIQTSRGDLVLIAPSARCHYHRHPDHDRWYNAWVVFQPKTDWGRWLQWPSLAEGLSQAKICDDQLLAEITSLLTQIHKLPHSDHHYSEELGLNLLEQLLIRVSRCTPLNPARDVNAKVERACQFLRQHLSKPITVEELAQHCHMSASRLAHLFKQELGLGPQQFRNRLRMQLACKLLTTSQLSIEAIGNQAGYQDPAQFSKYFRKLHGCSPRQFRQQHN